MAAFFPGAGPPKTLTPAEREMYLSQLPEVLYYWDRAVRDYHWYKVGQEGVDAILNPPAETQDSIRRAKAHRIFLEPYFGTSGMDALTAREFLRALAQEQVPDWVVELAPMTEIRQKAR